MNPLRTIAAGAFVVTLSSSALAQEASNEAPIESPQYPAPVEHVGEQNGHPTYAQGITLDNACRKPADLGALLMCSLGSASARQTIPTSDSSRAGAESPAIVEVPVQSHDGGSQEPS